MTPEPVVLATAPEVEAADELEEAAATLDSIADEIEESAQASHDAMVELLREVKECRIKLETLSASIGSESPSIAQLVTQTGTLQATVERIQADLAELRNSQMSNPPETEAVVVINPEEESARNTNENSQKGGNGGEKNSGGPEPKSPASNPSPIPEPQKKRRYVKI